MANCGKKEYLPQLEQTSRDAALASSKQQRKPESRARQVRQGPSSTVSISAAKAVGMRHWTVVDPIITLRPSCDCSDGFAFISRLKTFLGTGALHRSSLKSYRVVERKKEKGKKTGCSKVGNKRRMHVPNCTVIIEMARSPTVKMQSLVESSGKSRKEQSRARRTRGKTG